jgi:hypothetical protein
MFHERLWGKHVFVKVGIWKEGRRNGSRRLGRNQIGRYLILDGRPRFHPFALLMPPDEMIISPGIDENPLMSP